MPYIGRDEYYEEPLASPSAMWTDLYALTMTQTLFYEGRHNQIGTFHAFVRNTPRNAGYLVTAGQNIISEWLDKSWKFTDRDMHRLANKRIMDVKTGEMVPMFQPEFLEFIKNAKMELSVEMMPEGEIAFSSEPIYKVTGPVWQELLVESPILNTTNSQTSYATNGSVLKTAANGKMVAEFGLRRSPAVGGLSSTRGTYVGGIDASSNVWAETNYGIPTIGTMAHAYVMMHETEEDAYESWAKHNPNMGVFLPDTYEPKRGMEKIIEACLKTGIELQGFRQDSGDLGYLGDYGREKALRAKFNLTKNGASNDLDEKVIHDIEGQNPEAMDMYAVGTNAVVLGALGGVYKIANIYDKSLSHDEIMALKQAVREGLVAPSDVRNRVRDLMKLSSQLIKMTYPGELDLIRHLKEEDGKLMFNGGTICQAWAKDPLVYDDPTDLFSGRLAHDMMSVRRDNHTVSKTFNQGARAYRPLVEMFVKGELVGNIETVHLARDRALQRLSMLDVSHKRILNPHEHIVGVEESLLYRQEAMARRLRATGNTVSANLV